MEDTGRDDGITQAMRCVEAMQGQDFDTRQSLWRAAVKYAGRDKAAGAATGCYPGLTRTFGEASRGLK